MEETKTGSHCISTNVQNHPLLKYCKFIGSLWEKGLAPQRVHDLVSENARTPRMNTEYGEGQVSGAFCNGLGDL